MTSSNKQQRVYARTIEILLEQVYSGIAGSLFVGFVLSYFLWNILDHRFILVWLSALTLIAAFRTVIVFRYLRGDGLSSFYRLFMISLFLYGLTWGAIGLLDLPPEMIAYKAIVYFTLAGLVAAVVGKYSSRIEATICFCVPALTPLIIHCFWQNEPFHLYMGVISLIFLGAMLFSAVQIYRTTITSLELNEDLTDETEEHRQTSIALATSEKRYAILSESTFEAIIVHDTKIVLDINSQAETLFHADRAQMIGRSIFDLISPKFHQAVKNNFAAIHEQPYEVVCQRQDGTKFIAEVRAKSAYSQDEHIRITAIRDVTEKIKAETERERLIAELQEALSTIKTLSGIIPICSYCKRIRDDKGYWNKLEKFISEHSEAQLNHSICPQCLQKHYPEEYDAIHSEE